MNATIAVRMLMAGVLLALLGAACTPSDAFTQSCQGPVSGLVTEGEQFDVHPPPSYPFLVRVRVETDILIERVEVGSVHAVQAVLENASAGIWMATFQEQDLEQERVAALGKAVLSAKAYDSCPNSEPHAIGGPFTVKLGPEPGKAVTMLDLEVVEPADECYLPVAGAAALVRVSASKESVGGVVTLKANQGTFNGGTASGSSTELTLEAAGSVAQAEAYFTLQAAGNVVLTAAAKGSDPKHKDYPVVAIPEVDAPPAALKRDQASTVTFRTRGNFEKCDLTETVAGAADVQLIEPALGKLAGSTNVAQSPKSCADEEIVKLTVRFLPSAPDGAAVTIRCSDSYEQSNKATVAVANLGPTPEKPIENLTLEVIPTPSDECYLPESGGLALVRVTASAASAGATVTVKANQGELSGSTGDDISTKLVLQANGGVSIAEAYFAPAKAGLVLFTAGGNGATAAPVTIPVVAAPEVDGPSAPLARNVTSTLSFRTEGNFEVCEISETAAGAADVFLLVPNLGKLVGSASVLQTPKACSATEIVNLSVRFAPSTPDGAKVVIRCRDTFGQVVPAVVSVADLP